jgi:hypothetical protein
MRTQKRVTLSNWIEYFLFRGFEVLMGCFSLETTYKAGEFIGRLAFRFTVFRSTIFDEPLETSSLRDNG